MDVQYVLTSNVISKAISSNLLSLIILYDLIMLMEMIFFTNTEE